jgi:hypothetical protein
MSRPRRTMTFKQCLIGIAIWAVAMYVIFTQFFPAK